MEEDFKRRLSIKSVHFLDKDEYSDNGELDFRMLTQNSRRPRSKSNPLGGGSATSGGSLGRAAGQGVARDLHGSNANGEYNIRLKSDWLDATSSADGTASPADPHSCKVYKIAQRSCTRLSSSTPDLSSLKSLAPPTPPRPR